MSKKILLALCLLSLNNTAFASQDDTSLDDVPSSASDIQPQEALGSTMVHPDGKLTGNVTVPYRYQTDSDVTQTLGYLKSKSKSAPNDISSASDISPQEDLVSPEPTQPKPAAKVQKAAKKAKKPIAKKVTKTEPAVSNTIHTVITTTTATTTVKQTNPVVVNEPITPAQPAEKVELKSTSEITSEPNKAVPAHTDTVIAPQDATQAGVVIVPKNDASQAGVVIAPQEPAQPNPATNPPLEGNTSLEFNQSDVDLSESHKIALLELANKVKGQQNFVLKLQSYGSVASSDIAEARRISLQRAIKARKFLIEHEVNPNNISVNAVEDSVNKSNRIEIKIEKNS